MGVGEADGVTAVAVSTGVLLTIADVNAPAASNPARPKPMIGFR